MFLFVKFNIKNIIKVDFNDIAGVNLCKKWIFK